MKLINDCNFCSILYGDINKIKEVHKNNFIKDITKCLQDEWRKENVNFYVLGIDNFNLLKELGAKNIFLISRDYYLDKKFTGKDMHFMNKVLCLKEILEKYHHNVIFLDLDCKTLKIPDEKFFELLKLKNNGIQLPVRTWKRRRFGHRKENKRTGFTTCFMYCDDIDIIKKWISVYKKIENCHSERALNEVLDIINPGEELQSLINKYETPLCKTRSKPSKFELCIKDEYFYHR